MTAATPLAHAMGVPALVKALSHPLRVAILHLLDEADEPQSPSDMAVELGSPLGNVSYHVRTLADLKLVKLAKRKTRRGAVEHYYKLVPAADPVVAVVRELEGR